jgi:hypothetical protein
MSNGIDNRASSLTPRSKGVDKLFKTLASLASGPVYLLAKTENNWSKI